MPQIREELEEAAFTEARVAFDGVGRGQGDAAHVNEAAKAPRRR